MAQKLKLNTTHGKFRVKMHAVVLLVIILASLAIGFVAGQNGVFQSVAQKNCIPQTDFQLFIDDSNAVMADYKQCVSDLWNLQLSYKMTAAQAKRAANSTE